jgi:hypothetical protein
MVLERRRRFENRKRSTNWITCRRIVDAADVPDIARGRCTGTASGNRAIRRKVDWKSRLFGNRKTTEKIGFFIYYR